MMREMCMLARGNSYLLGAGMVHGGIFVQSVSSK